MEQQTIKAVEMTRKIRDRIYEQVKDMSHAEQIAFFRERAHRMNAKAATLVKTKRKPVRA